MEVEVVTVLKKENPALVAVEVGLEDLLRVGFTTLNIAHHRFCAHRAEPCRAAPDLDWQVCLLGKSGDEMPDAPVFLGLAAEVVARSRAKDRYPKVRWWGEMVNVLWERGDVAASMQLEDLFDQLAHQQDIAIFCSFLMDNFDGEVHARMLPRLGQNHSHLIPVEDYARLEVAVADALRETVGADDAQILEARLLQGYPTRFQMPRSQALLLALGQALPAVADAVRKRTRALYASEEAQER